MKSRFNNDFLNRQADPNDLAEIVHRLRLGNQRLGQSFVSVNNLDEVAAAAGPGLDVPCCVFYPVPSAFSGATLGSSGGVGLISHETTTGIVYTPDIFNLGHWRPINDGLTTTQYQTALQIIVCPNGVIYAACMFHPAPANSFLAYAPSVGEPFTILLDHAAMVAAVGSSDNTGLATLTFDPTVPERVVYSILYGGANLRTWIGDHTAFMAGANATINLGSGFGDMTYGENGWLVTGDGYVLYADDMMSIVRAGATSTGTRHTRAGISGTTIHWVDPGNTIAVGTDDCTSLVHGLGEILGSAYLAEKFLVCDPTGEIVLTVNNSTLPVRSIDDGTTFAVSSG